MLEKNKELYTECAKCGLPLESNNQGALDIMYNGGYGDFVDNYDGEELFFRLCHKHSHQFAYWLNNEKALTKYHGHAHNGSEKGFWYGHIGWDQYTWLSHLNMFLMHFVFDGFKFARLNFVRNVKNRINWCREDINDSSSPILWKTVFRNLFFLSNVYKGFFVGKYRKLLRRRFLKAKALYRSKKSLSGELWDKAVKGEFSDSEKALLINIGSVLKEQEEE